jgi:hypothetical protein
MENFDIQFNSRYVDINGVNQPGSISVTIRDDIGTSPLITIYKERDIGIDTPLLPAQPFVPFPTSPDGRKYTVTFPYEVNSNGTYILKLNIDGLIVTLVRVVLYSQHASGCHIALYTKESGVLAIQISNVLKSTANGPDYWISTGGNSYKRDSPASPGYGWAEALYNFSALANSFDVVFREDLQKYLILVTDFNIDLEPDPGQEPEPDPEPQPDGDPEPETNVILFNNIWFSRNPVTFNTSAAPAWNSPFVSNVRVRDDIRIEETEGSGNYASSMQIELPPASDGAVTFQVREAFRNMLHALPPALNALDMVPLTDRIRNFKHFIATLFDDEVEPFGEYEETETHRVMMGGLSKFAFKATNFFYQYLPSTRKFMTWAPVEKQVDRNQEDYLTYFNFNTLTTEIRLNFQAFFDDGTAERKLVSTIPAEGGQLYLIPAGPANSGVLTVNAGKNIVKYRLYLTNQNNKMISEVRTYFIDTISSPNKRILLFLNSLGGYEVIRVTGRGQQGVEIEKDTIVKFLPHTYSALDGEMEVNASVLRHVTNISSGYLPSKAWLDYMKDLLRSERVFDVTDGKRKPVVINPGSFDLYEDQNYELFVRFTIVESYDDENYTPAI